MDAGHKVYQVSQAEKDAVPEEVRRAAREMAEQAFKDRFVHIWSAVTCHMPTVQNADVCQQTSPTLGETPHM